MQNPLLKLFWHLTLFERKIIAAIAKHVSYNDSNTKAYCIRLIDFELDCLNPSDITTRLKGLREKTVYLPIDGRLAQVPLLTDIRYDDRRKNVTLTFNSILKGLYAEIKEKLVNDRL
ncbi:MAG: RepB family plasmid replication initiator protein [Tuberibacillus sp.]